jgi:hypothetical protein
MGELKASSLATHYMMVARMVLKLDVQMVVEMAGKTADLRAD